MLHIHSLVIMRSPDRRKYADERVSIKSEVAENFELKIKTKDEQATNTPGTCTLHTHLHAGGAIIRKGNNTDSHQMILISFLQSIWLSIRSVFKGIYCDATATSFLDR